MALTGAGITLLEAPFRGWHPLPTQDHSEPLLPRNVGLPPSETRIWSQGLRFFFAGRSALRARDPQPQPPGHRGGLTLPGHSKGNSPKPSVNLATRIRSSAGASRS